MDLQPAAANPLHIGLSSAKSTKFRPAMKPNPPQRSSTLSAFSTPGFQTRKQYPAQYQTNQDAISISSGSTSSSPQQNGIKRDSSGFSILDGVSPPLKRPKTVANEEKENIFPASAAVPVQQRRDDAQAVETMSNFPDLTQLPPQTLMKYQIYSLDLAKQFSEDNLAYHSGKDTEKDIHLIEDIRAD
ncbi:hypothetical protein HYPSUDRAFT_924985 [Hypholoma sublateritium FD-334 SS-4]|uniref:Uncharacterized protein n=1 Tax=Hypholoma sublateritium (strain FD-334 SS-4) TaxID=945553 RepID=A0A0D2P8J9_HYPSF|nr:hypothetical protein HYPSUDRAFT_924985 [Hypholoma sublateritium FD-334 SS-4]